MQNRRGFTLVELILTMSIIVLVGGVAVYSFIPFIQSRRIDQAATLLTGAVREAQVRATRDGRAWRVLIDGTGTQYSLQYYVSTGTAPQDCSEPGWTTREDRKLPHGFTLDVATLTRKCITFSATGRADWQNPHVVIDLEFPVSTPTTYFGEAGLMHLIDGVEMRPHDCANIPDDPRYNPLLAAWINKNPKVLLDAGDARFFTDIELGFYTNQPTYKYPATVIVEATSELDPASAPPQPPSTAGWTTLYSGPGPTETPYCGAKKDVYWLEVPVNGTYRFIRVTMMKQAGTNQYVILHEMRIPKTLSMRILGHGLSKTLTVSPVTGRITVQ